MRTGDDTRARAQTWLERHLTDHVAAGVNDGLTIALNPPSGQALRMQWPQTRQWALSWRQVQAQLPEGARLVWTDRILGPTRQQLPTRLHLPTIDTVAHWAGSGYPARLDASRARWAALRTTFPTTTTASVLRAVADWSDTDLHLLISTARWFAAHPVADYTWTPRQVPIPGLHAKWLDPPSRRSLIAGLINAPQVRLRSRPVQARVTYLDPQHAAAGRRRWDIITAGDHLDLAYTPTTLLIVENRDTAFYFPPVIPAGLAVLGNGDAVVNIVTSIAPLTAAARVIYWGDIDAEGLRIVSRLRSRGHQLSTMLMDVPTFDTYEK